MSKCGEDHRTNPMSDATPRKEPQCIELRATAILYVERLPNHFQKIKPAERPRFKCPKRRKFTSYNAGDRENISLNANPEVRTQLTSGTWGTPLIGSGEIGYEKNFFRLLEEKLRGYVRYSEKYT
ncbi:hypothetical protein AVEN_245371-1 [Araneus ventricosus]|uniref:Uncharacterized protein n=1 Tax=Araneus ventricosus TaxID=182803 RepID=A0A4Y2VJ43_ARAVE|nr:hypothetical protein AVEN_245371-1 [Araneus ventricosus]